MTKIHDFEWNVKLFWIIIKIEYLKLRYIKCKKVVRYLWKLLLILFFTLHIDKWPSTIFRVRMAKGLKSSRIENEKQDYIEEKWINRKSKPKMKKENENSGKILVLKLNLIMKLSQRKPPQDFPNFLSRVRKPAKNKSHLTRNLLRRKNMSNVVIQ